MQYTNIVGQIPLIFNMLGIAIHFHTDCKKRYIKLHRIYLSWCFWHPKRAVISIYLWKYKFECPRHHGHSKIETGLKVKNQQLKWNPSITLENMTLSMLYITKNVMATVNIFRKWLRNIIIIWHNINRMKQVLLASIH